MDAGDESLHDGRNYYSCAGSVRISLLEEETSDVPLAQTPRRRRVVNHFVDWLSRTSVSLVIQSHEWVVPTIQSIHIAAIGVVLASVFMIDLRILGWAGRDPAWEVHAVFVRTA